MVDQTETVEKLKAERLKYRYSMELEMIKATAAFEHAALRPLFLLNGGALVAYLALVGTTGKLEPSRFLPMLHWGLWAIGIWIAGLLLAFLAAWLGFKSQFAFRRLRGREVDREEIKLGLRSGDLEEICQAIGAYSQDGQSKRTSAVVCGCLSILLFIAGLIPAFASI